MVPSASKPQGVADVAVLDASGPASVSSRMEDGSLKWQVHARHQRPGYNQLPPASRQRASSCGWPTHRTPHRRRRVLGRRRPGRHGASGRNALPYQTRLGPFGHDAWRRRREQLWRWRCRIAGRTRRITYELDVADGRSCRPRDHRRLLRGRTGKPAFNPPSGHAVDGEVAQGNERLLQGQDRAAIPRLPALQPDERRRRRRADPFVHRHLRHRRNRRDHHVHPWSRDDPHLDVDTASANGTTKATPSIIRRCCRGAPG